MFVKLFQKMLDSSVWLESDSTVRVWVTLLLSMDSDGFCPFGSVENLANRARVRPSLTTKALERLSATVKRVSGGFVIDPEGYAAFYSKEHREAIPVAVREMVLERSGRQCVQCGSPEHLEIDHIRAWSRGGTNDPENLQALCRPCNRRKGARQ